jgi:hypothetical protein
MNQRRASVASLRIGRVILDLTPPAHADARRRLIARDLGETVRALAKALLEDGDLAVF